MALFRLHRHRQSGFTLVEMTVVLVIISLLTGAVLAGRTLIKSAELKAVAEDAKRYMMAVHEFQLQYNAMPGDFNNAIWFWGAADPNTTTCKSIDKTDMAATCNGDGNGKIDSGIERFLIWHHMKNAGLIEGKYSGKQGPAGATDHDVGINCPDAKIGGKTGYGFRVGGTYSGNSSWFDGEYGWNILMFGKEVVGDHLPRGAGLTPEELWTLDDKFDDGMPATGSIVTRTSANPDTPYCTTQAGTTASNTNNTHLNAEYRLRYTDRACVAIFRDVFE